MSDVIPPTNDELDSNATSSSQRPPADPSTDTTTQAEQQQQTGATNQNVQQQAARLRPRPGNQDGDTMERLFQALFYRIAVLYARAISKYIRRLIEFVFILMAVVSLALLIYLHAVFNNKPVTCLQHIQNTWPRFGVLRVELLENVPLNYNLQKSYDKEFQKTSLDNDNYYQTGSDESIATTTITPLEDEEIAIDGIEEQLYANSSNISLNDSYEDILSYHEQINSEQQIVEVNQSSLNLTFNENKYYTNENNLSDTTITMTTTSPLTSEANLVDLPDVETPTFFESFLCYFFDIDKLKHMLLEEQHILEYSLEYGLLRLSPEARERLNISVMLVTLDTMNNSCFGDGISKFMLDQFLGYNEILMSSIKQLAEKEPHKGYVRNVITGEHFRFVSAWQSRKWFTYIIALCIMVVFVSNYFNVAFITVFDLLRMIEHNTTIVFPAAPLLTVILALIGMEAIMSEFFNDASTAFYIILVVWIADQYDTICCHTAVSKRHWVRFFYLYHFAFYAYHYRFNGQYSGLALTASCLFVVHSMLYFFHHYELPVIEAQLVHIFHVDHNVINDTTPPPVSTSQTQTPVSGNEMSLSSQEVVSNTSTAAQAAQTDVTQPTITVDG
ncbi:unnamed protein product [Didymodactylos carnosus]|uniref:Membralin n=1 Tax=Didymodactylos carnosus TaxID=1234261 RepID=A0A813Z8S3_9BILA|nr:unnamed protein product [Didymodactylos carnosus]CAF3678393.1 unnamed protein product [Didymodactylos carnosus]